LPVANRGVADMFVASVLLPIVASVRSGCRVAKRLGGF
jgi:hypothetical protein